MVMPCQVSGQAVAMNSWKLAQASEVGPSVADSACATPANALMTTKARTEFFTVILSPNQRLSQLFIFVIFDHIYPNYARKVHSPDWGRAGRWGMIYRDSPS